VTKRGIDATTLTPAVVLRAYAMGIFPMARARDATTVQWVAPVVRGILPLDGFHVPRRLARTLRRRPFAIRCDTAFAAVVAGCAEPRAGHPETWINDEIARVFCELHRLGYAHSVEAWEGDRLIGGLYGLALGGAFFGESMFSRRTDASKIVLVHLVARLRHGGFVLLDTQFVTEHLRQFGAIELPHAAYLARLDQALRCRAVFQGVLGVGEEEALLSACLTQSRTQTS
jgi:leucyl/phenylalanyl-tRNA--protein transferase